MNWELLQISHYLLFIIELPVSHGSLLLQAQSSKLIQFIRKILSCERSHNLATTQQAR